MGEGDINVLKCRSVSAIYANNTIELSCNVMIWTEFVVSFCANVVLTEGFKLWLRMNYQSVAQDS